MTTTATASRTYAGASIPAAGTYTIDPVHSHIGFVVRHIMLAKVRGRFDSFQGSLTIGEDPVQSSVEVTVDTASVDTREEQRDGHLRSPDFLDVERFQAMTYRSTKVSHAGGDRWTVDGELTVHGVTRPVRLDVTFEGAAKDPWGNTRAAFSATAEVNREDFGLTWNQLLETGGVLVGKQVKIELEAEAILNT